MDMYSGYLNVSDSNKQVHYVFVGSRDSSTPATTNTAPIIAVLNVGQPGCSSMATLFQESGPYTFNDTDSSDAPEAN
jgi:carboxypeptidase C (cathepsin A)